MNTDPKTVEEIVKVLRCCGNTDTKKPDCEHCPLLSTRMCVKVMLEGSADLIESLQAQLSASQRETRAAVECINDIATNLDSGEEEFAFRIMRDWRGQQEAGKGETE